MMEQATASSPIGWVSRPFHDNPRVAGAGATVILISLAAALLPLVDWAVGTTLIGSMMVLAGSVEALAAGLRRQHRALAALPGLITLVAGVLFTVDPFREFVPSIRLLMAWLLARSLTLSLFAIATRGPARTWTVASAIVDFALGAALAIGLSASTFVIALFGPTPELVASYAWILALSFAVTGMMLIEVAGCRPPA